MNILPFEPGEEKVSTMISARGLDAERYLFFVTKNGTVKRMAQNALKNIRVTGIRALTLDEGDELITVLDTSGEDDILIASHNGLAVCFAETDVRPMGRQAAGVRGIRLREDDYVVGAGCAGDGEAILSLTEKGYGKRTSTDEYTRHGRGGKGMKNYQVTEKTGKVAAVKIVDPGDDILLITNDGTIIRVSVDNISVVGRAAQGVRVMRLAEGSRVIGAEKTERTPQEEEPAETEETPPAEAPTET